jgi:hypothetical protein
MYGMPASVNRRISWKPIPRVASSPTGPGLVRDPRRLLKASFSSGVRDYSTGNLASAAAFWTNFPGVSTNINYAANTFNTVANIVGAGEMVGFLGPTIPISGTAIVFTIEYTIDGAAPVQVVFAPGNVNAFAGTRFGHGFQTSIGDPFQLDGDIIGSSSVDATRSICTLSPGFLAPTNAARAQANVPRLRFESSLLVRASSSVLINGTASQERRSGLIYVLD